MQVPLSLRSMYILFCRFLLCSVFHHFLFISQKQDEEEIRQHITEAETRIEIGELIPFKSEKLGHPKKLV